MEEASQGELKTFVAKVEVALTPGFSEVLSEETRKTQRALLVLSFLLYLVLTGAVAFSGSVEFADMKFTGPNTTSVIVLLGFIICSYLETVVGIRCYSEWHLWRLRTRMGQVDIHAIRREIDALRRAYLDEVEEAVRTAPEGGGADEHVGPDDIEISRQPFESLPRHQRYFVRVFGGSRSSRGSGAWGSATERTATRAGESAFGGQT